MRNLGYHVIATLVGACIGFAFVLLGIILTAFVMSFADFLVAVALIVACVLASWIIGTGIMEYWDSE